MSQSDDLISPIDEGELQSALAAGERRIRAARQRKKQSIRRAILAGVIAIILIPLGITAGLVAGEAPRGPSLVVTWPGSGRSQLMASGDAVLSRGTSPLIVSVTHPEDWTVTWHSESAAGSRANFSWTPTSDSSTLVAQCRTEPPGWKKVFGFLWPTRALTLKAARAQAAQGGTVTSIGSGEPPLVWVAPGIQAQRPVAWDERALHLLDAAATAVPRTAIVRALAPESGVVSPPVWLLVPSWSGEPSAGQDDATYAEYRGSDADDQLGLLASSIYHHSPKVSIKFIVRLDQEPATGTIRLAFDGKRQHLAWVRRAGDKAGGPFYGWENASETGDNSASANSNAAGGNGNAGLGLTLSPAPPKASVVTPKPSAIGVTPSPQSTVTPSGTPARTPASASATGTPASNPV